MEIKIKDSLNKIVTSYPFQRLMKATISTVFVTVIAIMQEDVKYMYLIPVVDMARGMIFKHFGWNLDR